MGFGVKSITNLQKESITNLQKDGKKPETYKKELKKEVKKELKKELKNEVKIEEKKDIEMLQITQEELINLLIKYKIPVVRDTIIAIKQQPIFYVEK